jgi:sugar/nucleoside kinase (ribokinase family)
MVVELVTVGHILSETIIFADGRREGPVLGGPSAYCGVVTARLGIRTGIVTKVGPDASNDLLVPLREAKVDLSGIDFQSQVTTTNELIYSPDGTKQLKYLKQAPLITSHDTPAGYQGAQLFHICPLDYEVPIETVRQIRQFGKVISIDLGGYGGAHVSRETNSIKKLTLSGLQELISLVDVVKASDEDAALIFSTEERDGQKVQRFVDWGARVGILTQGAKGSLVFTREKKYRIPPLAGNVIDVTGGGDSFIGGFLVEYLRTGDAWSAGVFASAVALCVIERTGGVKASRMPTEQEARKRIPAEIEPEFL